MAKQINPLIKFKGSMHGISFYQTQDGYLAREKVSIDPERLKSDPAFRNTRRHNAEFNAAGKAGKLLRRVFNDEINNASDNRITSRLTQYMVAIAKSDPVSPFGQRKVELGDLNLLKDFEFNTTVPLSTVFRKIPVCIINRTSGTVNVNIPEFIPEEDIAAPKDLRHYNFFAAAAVIDFATGEYFIGRQSRPNAEYNETAVPAAAIPLTIPPNATGPIFVVLGLEFVQLVNGFVYTKSRKLSALQLIAIDLP